MAKINFGGTVEDVVTHDEFPPGAAAMEGSSESPINVIDMMYEAVPA